MITFWKSLLLRFISTKYPVSLYGCRSEDCDGKKDCICEDVIFSKSHFDKLEQEYTFYYSDSSYLFYKHKSKIKFLKVPYYYGV